MEGFRYLCIDLKSFYASVECVERGLDPMAAKLAVADPERGQGPGHFPCHESHGHKEPLPRLPNPKAYPIHYGSAQDEAVYPIFCRNLWDLLKILCQRGYPYVLY